MCVVTYICVCIYQQYLYISLWSAGQRAKKQIGCMFHKRQTTVCAQVQLLHWDYNCQTRRDHYFSSYYIDLLSYLSILYDLIGNYNFNPNTLCDFLHSLVVGT